MICRKKLCYNDHLLHLTLILSLLRLDIYSYLNANSHHGIEITLGSGSAYTRSDLYGLNHRSFNGYVHPKNVESMILDQQSIFHELNLLGAYGSHRYRDTNREVLTYLLNSDNNEFGGNEDSNGAERELNDNESSRTQTSPPPTEEDIRTESSDHLRESVQTPTEEIEAPDDPSISTEFDSSLDLLQPIGADLTAEDMDLIEVLLKQDIDLGVTREVFDAQLRRELEKSEDRSKDLKKESEPEENSSINTNPWAGLNYTIDSETGEHVIVPESEDGFPVDIDSPIPDSSCLDDDDLLSLSEDFPLEEALKLVGLHETDDLIEETTFKEEPPDHPIECDQLLLQPEDPSASPATAAEAPSDLSPSLTQDQQSLSEQIEALADMIQTTHQYHGLPHARSYQARVPYVRTVSMEQRWQDLANILSLPMPNDSHSHSHSAAEHHLQHPLALMHGAPHHHPHPHGLHPHHHGNFTTGPVVPGSPSSYGLDNRTGPIILHNASLAAPPIPDINSNVTYHGDITGDTSNIAAAVATSLTTMTNSSDPMGDSGNHGAYGSDNSSLGLYSQNHTSPEMNTSTDGFLSSILNDEDLQLMDMAISDVPYPANDRYIQNGQQQNITGMYTMRVMENEDTMDTSSDSAVSSMGSSERVPSISDGEWMETGSDSSPHPEEQDRTTGYYHGMDYPPHGTSVPAKYRPYEYSYAPGMSQPHRSTVISGRSDPGPSSLDRRMPPVAQKKYQLFGKPRFPVDQALAGTPYTPTARPPSMDHPQPVGLKYPSYPFDRTPQTASSGGRCSSSGLDGAVGGRSPYEASVVGPSVEGATALEPPEHKYSCTMEFMRQHMPGEHSMLDQVQHNHTYFNQLPVESLPINPRPSARDKQRRKYIASIIHDLEEQHTSRDEKRARSLKIPMTTDEIINLPMDEFNERLSKHDLTEPQLTLIRDIRRRGKNKVAAQNCRKRKLDQILSLAEEVNALQQSKEDMRQQQQGILIQRQRLKEKYSHLYRHVFHSLRDADGNPYSPYDFSLQQATDGSVILVPRNSTSQQTSMEVDSSLGAKSKKKDDPKK